MVTIVHRGVNIDIVIMDSATYMDERFQGDIIVCGSHGGEAAADYLLKYHPGGAIFNDAGKGKEDAGIKGLYLFDSLSIPAAAVDFFSSRIGDGKDTFESGVISAANEAALVTGVELDMAAGEAAMKMWEKLETKKEGKLY